MLVSLPGKAISCGELCYVAYGTDMAHATVNIQTKKALCCVTVVMLCSWFTRLWKQVLPLTPCCEVATVPACESEWTAASHTPGYTPPSDTSPACVRNPSLPADAASTGGTWSAKCMTSPTNYITSDMSHQSGYNLLLLLHRLRSALLKSNSYSTAWFVPPGSLRNKGNSSGAGCELIVNLCVCVCVCVCVV